MCLHNQSLIHCFGNRFSSLLPTYHLRLGYTRVCAHFSTLSPTVLSVMGLEGSMDDDLTNLNWLQDCNLLNNVTGRQVVRRLSEQNENQSPGPSGNRRVIVPPVAYDPRIHVHAKPPYSFSSLIFMAIESTPQKALPVKDIYSWIEQNFPFYRSAPCGWKNTIRHNLSLSKCFRKVGKQEQSSAHVSAWQSVLGHRMFAPNCCCYGDKHRP